MATEEEKEKRSLSPRERAGLLNWLQESIMLTIEMAEDVEMQELEADLMKVLDDHFNNDWHKLWKGERQWEKLGTGHKDNSSHLQ